MHTDIFVVLGLFYFIIRIPEKLNTLAASFGYSTTIYRAEVTVGSSSASCFSSASHKSFELCFCIALENTEKF